MGAKRRIKAKIEAAADKALAAASTGQAAGIDARRALAKANALVDVAAELLDDLAERGLHVELTIAGKAIPIGVKATIPGGDQG